MAKISRREAAVKVQRRDLFTGSNIFGNWYDDLYIVFSYGKHWPLFIYDKSVEQWFGNEDKYSHTTSTHFSMLHPGVDNMTMLGVEDMLRLVKVGSYKNMVKERLGYEHP